VTTTTRLPTMKDVPTLNELGPANFELLGVAYGLWAPKGTPAGRRSAFQGAQVAIKIPVSRSVAGPRCGAGDGRRCDPRGVAGSGENRNQSLGPDHPPLANTRTDSRRCVLNSEQPNLRGNACANTR
jgi:hypothetical protein